MKYTYRLILFLLYLTSCEKFLSVPPEDNPVDHSILLEGTVTVTDRINTGCNYRLLMLRADTPVKNYRTLYRDDYDNLDPSDDRLFSTDTRELWTYNLPDSLFAPGQRLKLLFRTYHQDHWWRCSSELVPNLVGLHGVLVEYFEDEMEVVKIVSICGQLVQVKVGRYYPPYIGSAPVLASNVPDALKIVGLKFRCTYRFAGYKEHKGCKLSLYDTQIVIKDIK